MASFPKEFYKTFKRTVSGSSILNASNHQTTDFVNKWIHPPVSLINGRIEYTLKFLGSKEVEQPRGTSVVREAIHKIRFQLQLNKGVSGHSGSKLQKVTIQISFDGLNILDFKSKVPLFKYQLYQISFCADDKTDNRVFSFIAKGDDSKQNCYVFLSDKLASQITMTVGEAFDLAYERFIKLRAKEDIRIEEKKTHYVLPSWKLKTMNLGGRTMYLDNLCHQKYRPEFLTYTYLASKFIQMNIIIYLYL